MNNCRRSGGYTCNNEKYGNGGNTDSILNYTRMSFNDVTRYYHQALDGSHNCYESNN
jgi:hypothetical protein